ncbi:hypothetical protein ACQKE0_05535 [Shewanella colwelliana]|uniref:hypothetical protein n=1 Tax=Shewanella colwelliana TaxID=23 RepID=UPI003D049AA3
MKHNKNANIQECQTYISNLYGHVNQDKEWEQIYGYVSRTTGYLARNVLKKDVKNIDFIRPISWLFSLATSLDICLQTSFQKKFPDICPYCLERTCVCFRTGKKPLKYQPGYKIIEIKREQFDMVSRLLNRNLDSAIKTISTIYPNNEVIWHFSGPWMNCSKLFEEVAELHESIVKFKCGKKNKESVEEEFADVFAWIVSAWISLNKDKSLDEEFMTYFYNGCPVCTNSPCTCAVGDERMQGVIDPQQFKELRLLFEELETVAPDAQAQIEGLIDSIKAVEDNQTESVANAAVEDAKSKFELLSNSLKKTDEVTGTLAKIGKSLMSIVGYFA